MTEIWKDIPGYPRYEISNEGRVWRKPISAKTLKDFPSSSGHRTITLTRGDGHRGSVSVHTLVADAFVEGRMPNTEVSHMDGNPANNRADNLQWMTRGDHMRHEFRNLGMKPRYSKLTVEAVKDIKRRRATGEIRRTIAADYGVTQSAIQAIDDGRSWAHV